MAYSHANNSYPTIALDLYSFFVPHSYKYSNSSSLSG